MVLTMNESRCWTLVVGQFVVDFINRGDIGVGLEGSSNSLSGVGKENWDKYHNKNCSLCDITKDYQLYYDGKPMMFDFIHSEEVFEHSTRRHWFLFQQHL